MHVLTSLLFFKSWQSGGNPNSATDYNGRTPLHIACTEGKLEVVKYLLLRGASTHVQDKYGQRPIDDAIQAENEDIIELLCDAGAHIGPMTMETARLMCTYAAQNKVSKLKAWQLAGADLNMGDYDKRTPLHVVGTELSENHVNYPDLMVYQSSLHVCLVLIRGWHHFGGRFFCTIMLWQQYSDHIHNTFFWSFPRSSTIVVVSLLTWLTYWPWRVM